MSVSYYEFDVNVIYHTRLKIAATGYENANEIAEGLMDELLSTGRCELIGFNTEDLLGAEAFDMEGNEVYRKGEI